MSEEKKPTVGSPIQFTRDTRELTARVEFVLSAGLVIAPDPDSPVAWLVLERKASSADVGWRALRTFSDVAGGRLGAWVYCESRLEALAEVARHVWGDDGDHGETIEYDSEVHDSEDAEGFAGQLQDLAELLRCAGVTGRA